MTDTTSLKITGMTCEHCVKHATKALEAVEGADNVKVDLQQGSATVEGSADTEQLISAVKEVGYEAELV